MQFIEKTDQLEELELMIPANLLEDTHSLVEGWLDLSRSIPSIRSLRLNSTIIRVFTDNSEDLCPQDGAFPQLTDIRLSGLCFEYIRDIRSICYLIGSSPVLKRISVMLLDTDVRQDFLRDDSQPADYSESMFEHLDETFEHLDELELVWLLDLPAEWGFIKFILDRSPILRRVRLRYVYQVSMTRVNELIDGWNKYEALSPHKLVIDLGNGTNALS